MLQSWPAVPRHATGVFMPGQSMSLQQFRILKSWRVECRWDCFSGRVMSSWNDFTDSVQPVGPPNWRIYYHFDVNSRLSPLPLIPSFCQQIRSSPFVPFILSLFLIFIVGCGCVLLFFTYSLSSWTGCGETKCLVSERWWTQSFKRIFKSRLSEL